ncbi:calcium-binding protein [Phormidesmis sp. 146-33]
MADSAQTGLQSIFTLLNNLTTINRGAPGVAFNDLAANNDLFIGDLTDSVARGQQGNDLLLGNVGNDFLMGDTGVDGLFGGPDNDQLRGGAEDDTLFGEAGNDILVGDAGVDFLVGGEGKDQFVYTGDPFANGVATPAGQTGINVLNKPDIISDFTIGEDQLALGKFDLNLANLNFQQGKSSEIGADGNLIVLTDPFPAAGAAARAIANNDKITSKEGVFAYFNSTLGLTRFAYSQDLGGGGNVSVLANLDNQRGDVGMANITKFTAADFTLV